MDNDQLRRVRLAAQAILRRLGPDAPRWRVLDLVERDPSVPMPSEDGALHLHSWMTGSPPGPLPGNLQIMVTVGIPETGEAVTAYYPLSVPEKDAIVVLASQLQDHATESSWGQPLPPCPGHTHPAKPVVAAGVAVWQCPKSSEHYQEPILQAPNDDGGGAE